MPLTHFQMSYVFGCGRLGQAYTVEDNNLKRCLLRHIRQLSFRLWSSKQLSFCWRRSPAPQQHLHLALGVSCLHTHQELFRDFQNAQSEFHTLGATVLCRLLSTFSNAVLLTEHAKASREHLCELFPGTEPATRLDVDDVAKQ